MDFTGTTALVTGANRGLGRHLLDALFDRNGGGENVDVLSVVALATHQPMAGCAASPKAYELAFSGR